MYRAGFVRIFETFPKCEPSCVLHAYSGHSWEEDEARSIAAALEYASQKCKLHPASRPFTVSCEGNHFGETGVRLIQQAVKFTKIISGVRF